MWRSTWFWLAIAGICFALDAGALFYQHVLEVYPCELCIYVRVWVLAIMLLSLMALVVKHFAPGALIFSLAGLALSIGLAKETYNLLAIEYDFGTGGACSFFANFPSWAPLDKWLPSMFQVQELCAATPDVLFGISMAEALALASLVLLLAFLLAIIGSTKALFSR